MMYVSKQHLCAWMAVEVDIKCGCPVVSRYKRTRGGIKMIEKLKLSCTRLHCKNERNGLCGHFVVFEQIRQTFYQCSCWTLNVLQVFKPKYNLLSDMFFQALMINRMMKSIFLRNCLNFEPSKFLRYLPVWALNFVLNNTVNTIIIETFLLPI